MTDAFLATVIAADTAAGIAYAILMTTIASQYVDLADDYYDLYKQQRDYYYNFFQMQGELPLNNALFSVPFYVPLYTSGGTYIIEGAVVHSSLFYFNPEWASQTANFEETFQNHLRMFNSAELNPVVPTNLDFAEISDDWLSYMFRYEEHRRDVYNARRYAQQMDSLSYGVKEGAQVERGLATSFMQFDEAQGNLVSATNALSDGYFGLVAYKKQVNEMLEIPKSMPDRIMASNFDTSAGPSQ